MNKNSWEGRSVLVTGATGLLGSWMVPELVRRKADVVILVRDGSPRSLLVQSGWLERIPVVYGSITDPGLLRRTMAEYDVDVVFHLAAQTLVGVAGADPVGTLEANVRGTWNVLEAARQIGVSAVLVASSDKAYGSSANLPYDESHPLHGRYPYDVSKSCADLIAQMYATTFGLPVGITRCANLFGGGDLNFSRSIPGVIRATLRGERFRIRSDGKYVRDYLYVEDAVDAYLCLGQQLLQDRSLSGEAFNFCLSCPVTVLELVNKVLALMGRQDLEPIIENRARGEIREQYMVAHKASKRLGWKPRFTLEQGLRRTIDWYRRTLGESSAQVEGEVLAGV